MSKKLLIIIFTITLLFSVTLVIADFGINDGETANRGALGESESETATFTADGQACDVTWTLDIFGGRDAYDISKTEENGAIDGAETAITCTREGGCADGYSLTLNADCDSCDEDWQCGAWDTCTDDQQARTCTDQKHCNPLDDTREETQACEEEPDDPDPKDPDPQPCSESWECSEWETMTDDCECVGNICHQKYERDCEDTRNCGTTKYEPSDMLKVQCIEGVSTAPPDVVDNQPESQQQDNSFDYERDSQQEEEGFPTYIWVGAGVLGGMLVIFMIGGVVYMLRK